jgi:hypothetical protein
MEILFKDALKFSINFSLTNNSSNSSIEIFILKDNHPSKNKNSNGIRNITFDNTSCKLIIFYTKLLRNTNFFLF